MEINFFRDSELCVAGRVVYFNGRGAKDRHPKKRDRAGRVEPTKTGKSGAVWPDDENAIFELINDERGKKGLNELEWDDRLARLARDYSRRMAKESFFSHFDRDGNSVVERAGDAGIRDWKRIGENLFYCEGYGEFDDVAVRGWMNSPEHRRNILDRQFNTTGIGIAEARDGRIYITQIFLKR